MRLRNTIRAAVTAAAPLLLVLDGSAAGTLTAPRHTRPPPLALVEKVLLTTAKEDFGGREDVYHSAVEWEYRRFELQEADGQQQQPRPYIACFGNGSVKEALSRLEKELRPSPRPTLTLSVGKEESGSCFLATVQSLEKARGVSDSLQEMGLVYFAPFPSALKLAPGLLNLDAGLSLGGADEQQQQQQQRLTTTHGKVMNTDHVEGLTLELSPGVLPAHDAGAGAFISDLTDGLLSTSVDLHASSFWSDAFLQDGADVHEAHPASTARAREWRRAADVVHGLGSGAGPTPGDVCSWDAVSVSHMASDVLLVTGLDHLLAGGRGAGGSAGAESDELQMACFMGLVSYLACKPQVFRVAPFHKAKLLNAVAGAITQSATITDTPLTDAGLDGSGEVIQVIDSGLDQESCFFRDDVEGPVESGYHLDALAEGESGNAFIPIFSGGDYRSFLERRKVVQYISLVDSSPDPQYQGSFTYTGSQFTFYDGYGFETDPAGGHGSHTAGTAAGVMLDSPPELECGDGEELGCLGGCFESDVLDGSDLGPYSSLPWARICPVHDCEGLGADSPLCLDDPKEALAANRGVAAGAKLAVFDVGAEEGGYIYAFLAAENGLWDAAEETGAKVHSNSWGTTSLVCGTDSFSIEYDKYMYDNPEHLLIFAAGNDGLGDTNCAIGSPAIGKNVLAVGSSSSGDARFTTTNTAGEERTTAFEDYADIDTVSHFSSRGPTTDNRIKPEIVAPGDLVISVSSAGPGEGATCEMEAQGGTSMSAPVVAGAAAMIRQYFKESAFYVADLEARGLCASPFLCEEFSPSAATVKAVLINSANLMGGSSEPDGDRGFGRVHLEEGLPLEGAGQRGLLVVDSSTASVAEGTNVDYTFETDGSDDDAVEFRATLAWIDFPASDIVFRQLVNDLDLVVIAPSGNRYTMWSDGRADADNIIERVIIPADDFAAEESGTWTVKVSAADALVPAGSQSYSLVVAGPFGNGKAVLVEDDASAASSSHGRVGGTCAGLWLALLLPFLAGVGAGLLA